MNASLTDQLRAYFADLESQAEGSDVASSNGVVEPLVVDLFEEDDEGGRMASRSGWIVGAAAALILIVGGVALMRGDDTVTEEPADQPEPSTIIGAEAPPDPSEVALGAAVAWYAAVDAGDIDAMEAIFTPSKEGESSTVGVRSDHLEVMMWRFGQGSFNTDLECSAGPVSETGDLTVMCTYLNQQGIPDLVGAPPVENTDSIHFRSDGTIRWISQQLTQGSYLDVINPFEDWLEVEYPDEVAVADCCGWESIETARQVGERRLELGELWAAYLDENGCTYATACEPAS